MKGRLLVMAMKSKKLIISFYYMVQMYNFLFFYKMNIQTHVILRIILSHRLWAKT